MNISYNFILLIFIFVFKSLKTNFVERNQFFQLQKSQKSNTCGIEFTNKQFFLQSPNYPENYPSNIKCDYFLKAPNDCPARFKFDFIDFRLENSVGCIKDRLVIDNQDVLCGKGPLNPNGIIYFTNNGTLDVKLISDTEGGAAGFKIFVTRIDCDSDLGVTGSMEISTEQELTTPPFRPFHFPLESKPNLSQCCLNIFNSRRFVITSPNFPNSLDTTQECTIKIEKSDENVCRLRLNFLYFHMGFTSYNNCPYGYLKIDGKYVCGCNRGLKLTTSFENHDTKVLEFKSDGIKLNSKTGFVIEVIQDECPTKYYPANSKFANISTGVVLKDVYNSYTSNKQIQLEPYIEQAQLIHQSAEISDATNSFNSKFVDIPRSIKTFYYFAEPDYSALPIESAGNEQTTFIDTSTINTIVTNFNSYQCKKWNDVQIETLISRYGRDLQTCRQTQNADGGERSNCVELDYLNGYIRSPGYPFSYPENLNICYRFIKQTGYCFVKLFMVDFQMENSYGCHKDYILLENGNKYCGKKLFGQYLTLDLTTKNYADVTFVTDNYFCGRGFYGLYNQIPCQANPGYPARPDTVPTTTTTTAKPTCDRYISDKSFVLQVNQEIESCSFQIKRFSEDSCKINLYFEEFDLYCGSESLVLDNMLLCGHLTGRKINFEENDIIQILYKSNLINNYGQLKFRISGEQINDDCLFPEVPAQRLEKKT